MPKTAGWVEAWTRRPRYAFMGEGALFRRILIVIPLLFVISNSFAESKKPMDADSAVNSAEAVPVGARALTSKNLKPIAKSKKTSLDAIYKDLKSRSYPADAARASLLNPWGERLLAFARVPHDFGLRLVAAAQVYSDQSIRFDGYMGSEDDGIHYTVAADGLDKAYYGDTENKTYYVVCNKSPDDLSERSWVCLDYPVHTLTLAGFPLREAMIDDFQAAPDLYTQHGMFSINRPANYWFFRRVPNLKRYFKRQQFYSEDRIAPEQYRDPKFKPRESFMIGDILFLGHYGDNDGAGPWSVKHSGVVASVDERGMPVKVYNMRVSSKMYDDFNGLIDQTRTIGGKQVYFERFSDRYSLAGHGRIIHPFVPRPEDIPHPGAPVVDFISEALK